ncbi:type IV pilin protein [Zhongshania sp.]|uniref:type IV pilin protein n=1 Tax=Zhongshania sp. TaxID=1971902 RepID=UPI0035670434
MNKLRASVQRGFTLVELVIVVLILSVLAAIVIPQFTSSTDDAKVAALDSSLSGVRTAIDMYYQNHGHYPGSVVSSGLVTCVGGTAGAALANTEAAFLDHLTRYTNAAGQSCSTTSSGAFPFGPYYKKDRLPKDPIVGNLDTVTVVSTGNLEMTATGTLGGWLFDSQTGKFIVNHTSYDDR